MFTARKWRKTQLFKRKHVNYSSEPARKKLINYLQSELRTSTTHGLPHVVNTKAHWIERLVWAACMISCMGLACHMLYIQYARFVEAPTVISVEKDYFNWNVSFPAFTLCPYYKPDIQEFPNLVNETSERTGWDMEQYLWSILCAGIGTLETLDLDLGGPEMISLIDPREYAALAARGFQKIGLDAVATSTNWPIRLDVAMTELGLCYVINSNVAQYDWPELWRNNVTPPYRKSNIELSIHDSDFFTEITVFGAYKLFLHSPDEAVLSTSSSYMHSDRGFISIRVNPFSSRISDKLRNSSMQLRKCRFVHEPISKRYPIYSYNHCLLECRINMIKSLCGCVPHFYKPLTEERICNIAKLKCVVRFKKEILSLSASGSSIRQLGTAGLPRSSRDCGCLSVCETDTYLKDYASFVRGTKETDQDRTKVGLSSFPKVRIVRDVIFSYDDILLRTVGVINLCFGSSVLSIVELVIIVMKTIVYVLVFCRS